MNVKLSLLGLVSLIALSCYLMTQPTSAIAEAPAGTVVKAAGTFDYAQLTIDGKDYTFEEGGFRVEPRTFDLSGVYRSLNGRQRPSLVNLLQVIGDRGWELVDVSQDRSIYVFKRSN